MIERMFNKNISSLKEKNILRTLRIVESIDGMRAMVDGRPCTLFCTNDYLGLSKHPALAEAAYEAIRKEGFGAGSAPLIAGHTPYHARLAGEIASFKGAQDAILFGSGYLANAGLIPALAGEGDVIFSDSLNHASIIDGCRLSRAVLKVYPHKDISSLDALLKSCAGYKRRLIVTEGVFSMDGDIAPLPEISALAARHSATLLVDEAHATGVLGPSGRGTLEHYAFAAGDIIQMGTLGKALGSYGAFVASNNAVFQWLINSARSFMFSTSLPPAACASASAALQIINQEPERLHLLRENTETLRASLKNAGFNILGEGTPIIPVMVGDAANAVKLAEKLLEYGFYAPAIRPPTVPEGASRIRFTVSALHTRADIEALMDALRRC
jgi:8-amino-7-oxononanoate synthase